MASAAQLAAGTLDAASLLADTYTRIAAQEDAQDGALGALVARLDLATALQQLKALVVHCRACRSPSRTFSTPAICPPAMARPCMRALPAAMQPWSARFAAPAGW